MSARSPQVAPLYAMHRHVKNGTADTPPITDKKLGMNMAHYRVANIQIIPLLGGNPNVEVLFWSDEAARFISANPALTKTGTGADTPFEFNVDVNGRIIFVLVSGGTFTGDDQVKIMVGGYELDHTL